MNRFDGIEIKVYEEDYEKLVLDFEKASALEMGEEFPENLIKTYTNFTQKYSEKSKTYEWSEILIAIEKSSHEVVGTAQMMMKTVVYAGKPVKFIEINGLKVHPELYRQGLGRKIYSVIRKKSKSLGISHIYARIPIENHKVESFFKAKLRFEEVAIVSAVIIRNPIKNNEVQEISTEKALELTQKFYDDKDMAIVDLQSIFKAPALIKSFIIYKGNEYIGGSLWNTSYYGEVEILSVLFIDSKHLKNNFTHALFQTFLIFMIFFYFFIWYCAYEFIFEERAYKITTFTLFLLGFLYVIKSYLAIIKFVKQLRLAFKPRLKIFGIFYTGTIELKRNMFQNLLRHMAAFTENKYCTFEYHEHDIYSGHFKGEDFCKLYLEKKLNQEPVFKWNKRMFIDPRD